MFLRSRNPLPTFLLTYYVRVTPKIHFNVRYRRYSKVLMFVSYRLLKFLHYLCLRGQEIYCRHSYYVRMTSKIQVNFRFKRHSEVLIIVSYGVLQFLQYLYFEVKLFIAGIPTKLPCLCDFEYPGQPSVHELPSMGDLENLQNPKLVWIFEVPRAW